MILFSFFAIPAYLATAFIITLVSLKKDEYVPYVAIAGSLMALIFCLVAVPMVLVQSPITMQMEEWAAPYGITIYGDYLSIFLSSIIAFVGFLIIIFSYHYVNERRTKYYALLSLLFAGIFGVIHSGDMFNLFVFTELMSLASYGLVAFNKKAESLEASIKYLIIGSLGTSMMLIGIAFLYGLAGTLNMADIVLRIAEMNSPSLALSFGLIMSGLAIKSGFVPFHAWLIDAHPAAPSPVSAVLSGLMINVGVYSILRIGFVVFSGPQVLLTILLVIGTLSMVIGAVAALRQDDLKRMLAYSSISQIGYIGVAFGLGTMLGIVGGMFHLINQIFIKSLLFLCAGALVYYTGTVKFDKLSKSYFKDKVLSFSFLVGILALAGVPLLSGFASKWIIYIAALETYPLIFVLTIITTAITLAYGLKAYSIIFSSNPEKNQSFNKRLPNYMRIPLILLAVVIIILGVMPIIGIEITELMAIGLDALTYVEGVPR